MWKRLKAAAASFRREIEVNQLVRHHPRTPRIAKALIGAAAAYALSPTDLIPNFIPVIGHLDDAVIVLLLVVAALKLIPKDVVEECRAKVETETPLAATVPTNIPERTP